MKRCSSSWRSICNMFTQTPQRLTSWGRYPQHIADCYAPQSYECEVLLPSITAKQYIPRGLGRSYGDSAIADAVILTHQLRYFIAFDEVTGILHCQSGVSLAEILE